MFVAELTESFKGISDKLLPGAIPAVDCAVAYGFAPANAVTVGFFCGALGQFLAIAGLLIFHSPVMIIAGFVPLFSITQVSQYMQTTEVELKQP